MGRLRREWEARPAGRVTHVVTVSAAQERLLDETLESVRRQTYRAGDVLVVRWGEEQQLPDIAAARNHAIATTTSPMVRLVEAGDVLPWHSTALLVRALRGGPHGSAAGRTARGDGWRDTTFASAAGTDPGLADRLVDRTAWLGAGLSFDPAHGRFGDAALVACEAALGCARIGAVTFEDRGRALGLPFGHLRVWSAEADAWLAAIEGALAATPPRGWAASVVDVRLPALLGDVERLDEQQWQRTVAVASRLLATSDPEAVRAESSVLAHLTAQGDRAGVTELILARWWDRSDLPTSVRDGDVVADLPGADRVPEIARTLTAHETPLVIRPLRRTGSALTAVAFIRGVDTSAEPTVEATFRGRPAGVRAQHDPAADRFAAEALHDHAWSWLDIGLDAGGAGELRLRMSVSGVTREAAVRVPATIDTVDPAAGDPRGDDEIGPFPQTRLQRAYSQPREPDPTLAYFQAYTGQAATDSPLAIHEALRRARPDIRTRWAVDSLSVPLPEGAEAVLWRSREWYATLATARWLVTNIEMERWFRRKPGQVLVQTWHGNPGKSMGLGAWREAGLTPGRIEQALDHGPRNWSLLVSPSPEMTRHYREQFAYDGPVVEHGYPRDDALVGPGAAALRGRARATFGLAEDDVAVLYAPTWRPELATNHRRARLSDAFDVERAAAALGPGHVLLLRGHRFHRDRPTASGRVLDVTEHPEVNDVIAAADVAVLDYSSLRFDFALTGRPMVFCVPDMEAYFATRGFLYDFADSAPGPLLRTTEEVVSALRDLPALAASTAEARATFNARFNAHQDGHAAERVVEAMIAAAE